MRRHRTDNKRRKEGQIAERKKQKGTEKISQDEMMMMDERTKEGEREMVSVSRRDGHRGTTGQGKRKQTNVVSYNARQTTRHRKNMVLSALCCNLIFDFSMKREISLLDLLSLSASPFSLSISVLQVKVHKTNQQEGRENIVNYREVRDKTERSLSKSNRQGTRLLQR
jgi:hypothetical protein